VRPRVLCAPACASSHWQLQAAVVPPPDIGGGTVVVAIN